VLVEEAHQGLLVCQLFGLVNEGHTLQGKALARIAEPANSVKTLDQLTLVLEGLSKGQSDTFLGRSVIKASHSEGSRSHDKSMTPVFRSSIEISEQFIINSITILQQDERNLLISEHLLELCRSVVDNSVLFPLFTNELQYFERARSHIKSISGPEVNAGNCVG